MRSILLTCTLALASATVHAAPVTFFDSTYSISAVAIAGATVDTHSADSATSPWPLFISAQGSSGDGLAASSAVADYGVLGTIAEALGADVPVSAIANASFVGSFIAPGGPVQLNLDFTADVQNEGTGSPDSFLRVSLLSGAKTLFDTTFSSAGTFTPVVSMVAGEEGLLTLSMTSAADAPQFADISTANHGLTFSVQAVPEPSTMALGLMAGVFLAGRIAWTRGRRRSA